MMETMQRIMRPATALRISVNDSTVTVQPGELDPVTYQTDGKRRDLELPDGQVVKAEAKWNGTKLRIETRIENGPRITEEYELKEDGADLQVTVRVEMRAGEMRNTVKRVYTRD